MTEIIINKEPISREKEEYINGRTFLLMTSRGN
jgi:hypothetical protein